MTESLFTTQTPGSTTSEANPGPTLGTVIEVGVDGTISALRWYCPPSPPSNDATLPFVLYDATTQAELARVVPGSVSAGWNQVSITPVDVTAGQYVLPAVRTADRYAYGANFFQSVGLTNGDLSAPATGSDPFGIGNGRFREAADGFPNNSFGGHCYFTDIVFTPAGAAGPTVSVWDGSAEVAATVTVWDGTTEVAATVDQVTT